MDICSNPSDALHFMLHPWQRMNLYLLSSSNTYIILRETEIQMVTKSPMCTRMDVDRVHLTSQFVARLEALTRLVVHYGLDRCMIWML